MSGHRISGCLGDGIVLIGSGTQLEDGSVDGCAVAVRVEGSGSHQIRDVVASDSTLDGFRINSDRNKLTNTSAVGNAEDGYDITGARNTLKANSALNNFQTGFLITGGSNKFNENLSSSNGDNGYAATGDLNKFVRNLAESTTQIPRSRGRRQLTKTGRSVPLRGRLRITGNGNKLSKNVAATAVTATTPAS
jgi:hypothetical protein